MQRTLSLDVYDYAGHALCNLYDSTNDIVGQAHDVFVNTERNGFKELRFNLPSTCEDEKNYRLNYLVADYRIRFREVKNSTEEIDWFLISEPKVTHSAFSTDYEIRAGHISQLLNTKNLNLEFSDDEGNNTGTIGQIAATILEGTGWHLGEVAQFFEEDKYNLAGKEKVRSFTASAKSGAFKMMNDLCEMFDAKPIYHGSGQYKAYIVKGTNTTGEAKVYADKLDSYAADRAYILAESAGWTNLTIIEQGILTEKRTVDIIPINPFSEKLDEGVIPPDLNQNKILELYYDKNIGNISRTLNSESLVTVLTAYGSYGDRNGLCSLQKAEHAEITFGNLSAGDYGFIYQQANYYFSLNKNTSNLKWSSLDFTSRSYVYNGTDLFKVYKEPQKRNNIVIEYTPLSVQLVYVKNQVAKIMDFSYYDKIGLLNNDMLRKLAEAQTSLPAKHLAAEEASVALSKAKQDLSRTASAGEGFLLLNVTDHVKITDPDTHETHGQLIIDPKNYCIYRSDYDESTRNYFSWNTATSIKKNGRPLGDRGAVVYIVHRGNPTTWEKTYIKSLGNRTNDQDYDYYRDSLGNIYKLHDKVYYPSYNIIKNLTDKNPNFIYVAEDTLKMYVWANNAWQEIQASGYFYGLNEFDFPTTITLWQKEDTYSPGDLVYLFSADSIAGLFGPREDGILSNREAIEEATKVSTVVHPLFFVTDSQQPEPAEVCATSYGWYYRSYTGTYNFGTLHFCWGEKGDTAWNQVYISYGDENPAKSPVPTECSYYYSIKRKTLYKGGAGRYVSVNDPVTVDGTRLNSSFAAVIDGCITQEILTKGVSEQYNYDTSDSSFNPSVLDNNGHLPIGNYAFKNEYNNYWLFTTDRVIEDLSLIKYVPADKILWQDSDDNHILKAIENSFKVLEFPNANELDDVEFTKMGYSNGTFTPEGNKYVGQINGIHENTTYEFNLPENSTIVCRTSNNNNVLIYENVTTGSIPTPDNTTNIRIVCNVNPHDPEYPGLSFHVYRYNHVFFSKNKQYIVLNSIAAVEKLGINYLMNEFIRLCNDAYLDKLPRLKAAQQEITNTYISLSNELGDMYREGYWQENNYVEGDENKLYSDSMDNLKEISHPQATYDFKFLDLYGSDDNLDAAIKTEYPDIDTDYAVHLVDPDIDTNRWAYIDKLNKCYDQKWKTQIEINTRLSMIGQQSFTDVLAKIAEVANETKAKQTIYSKAEVIGNAGQLAADKLEGLIQANKIYISGSTSNWYTDAKGNIIFEDVDGNSAMMLTGRGLMIADSREVTGDWNWRTALSGKGFNCDVIATGEFSAKHIIAGTITVDKLSSGVGQELEIGSNKALTLYATVDGLRPVDGMMTKHPEPGDSWIQIAAKNGNNPAYIDVQSGGKINLYGGSSVNIESNGNLSMKGSTVDITATNLGSLSEWTGGTKYYKGQLVKRTTYETVDGVTKEKVTGYVCTQENQDQDFDITKWRNYDGIGRINIESGGSINIKSGAEFLVDSENFKIAPANTAGKYNVTIKGDITTTGGNIAGFTIGKYRDELNPNNNRDYLYTGTKQSLSNNPGRGIYIGTDGINIGDKFIFSENGNTASLTVNASQIFLGDIADSSTLAEKITKIDTNIGTAQSTADGKAKTFRMNIATMRTIEYKVGDILISTDATKDVSGNNVYLYKEYICHTATPVVTRTGYTQEYWLSTGFKADWNLTGTASVGGAALIIDTDAGNIEMISSNTITIAASQQLSLLAKGTVSIGNGGKPFTIGATSGNTGQAYIYNGVTSINDTSHTGIYVGTDGINIRSSNYRFLFDITANEGAKLDVSAANINLGSTTLSDKFTTIDTEIGIAKQAAQDADTHAGTADTHAGEAKSAAAAKPSVWYCPSTGTNSIFTKTYKVNDIWYDTSSTSYGYQYVCHSTSAQTVAGDWALVGTSITKGAALQVDAGTGDISIGASKTIKIASSGTVAIAANEKLTLTTNGSILIGKNSSHLFTIAGDDLKAYMQIGGRTSYNSTTAGTGKTNANTVYVGTDGISLGTATRTVNNDQTEYYAPFTVSSSGALYAASATIEGTIKAKDGNIAGWYIGSNYIGTGNSAANSKVGIGTGTNDNDYVFWAGNNSNNRDKAKFAVLAKGEIRATAGTIANWEFSGNSISRILSSNFNIGMDCNTSKTDGNFDEPVAFWAGTRGAPLTNMEFYVTKQGKLHAEGANISGTVDVSGKIVATSGQIAEWEIDGSTLKKVFNDSNDYRVEMGWKGNYAGYWMGSDRAYDAPLAMVINHNPSARFDNKAEKYSLTAGNYYWSWWETRTVGTGDEAHDVTKYWYYKFNLQQMFNDGYIDSTPVEILPE